MDSEAYHRQETKRGEPGYVMGSGDLRVCAANPRKWRQGYLLDENEIESSARLWGSMLDCRVTDAKRFDARYAVRPATYPAPEKHAKVKSGEINAGNPLPWNANAAVCAEWEAAQGDKTLVKKDVYEQCSLAIQQLHDDPICDSVLTGAKFQAYCRANWQDAETEVSVPIQVLLDIVPDAGSVDFGKDLVDLKSDTNAAPRLWQANVFKYGYDLQAALYLDVYTQATQEDRCTFGHIISESVFPFYAEYRRLSEEYLAVGRAKVPGRFEALRALPQDRRMAGLPFAPFAIRCRPGRAVRIHEDTSTRKPLRQITH